MSGQKPEHPQNNPLPGSRKDSSEKETHNRHVYIEPGAQIDFVKDFRQEYKTSQEQSTTHNKKQLFWTKIAACLLVVTAFFTGWQVWMVYKAEGDRPWIGIEKYEVTDFAEGSVFKLGIQAMNSGKRPGLVNEFHYHIEDVASFQPHFEKPAFSSAVVFPEGRINVVINDPVPLGYFASLRKAARSRYIYVSINYLDVRTHESHWTHWCVMYTPPDFPVVSAVQNDFRSCPTYNDAD